MMPFEYFIKTGEVKKASVDLELAKSLIKDMDERIQKSMKLDVNEFSKMIFENIYDALRDFCDALLSLEGYKSYSHQASISFLTNYKLDVADINELDQFRYKRNGSKYYGKPVFEEDALEIKKFFLRIKPKINKILEEKKLK